jgi:predicted RNA methylase
LHNPGILTDGQTGSSIPPIIELGAGTGFLSILLAQLGADVMATDLDGDGDDGRQTPLGRLAGNIALSPSILVCLRFC